MPPIVLGLPLNSSLFLQMITFETIFDIFVQISALVMSGISSGDEC